MRARYRNAAKDYEDFRRWIFSQGTAAVSSVVAEPEPSGESELEIQARWFGGEFGRDFTGLEGERIEIVQFGHWNRAAGPDFTEAAVKIDGVLKTGAIELDLDVRDWESHGHGSNPGFEETVLHVFTDGPSSQRFFTRTRDHRAVPQVQLPQYAWSQGPPDFLPEAFPGRCVAPLSQMTDEEVDSLLFSAAEFRLKNKVERLRVMQNATSQDQALFQAIAEALGFRQNKTAMAILAQRCPIAELLEMEPFDREARLFGMAGFLRGDGFFEGGNEEAARYLRGLWERWWRMRDCREISRKRAVPWCFSGNRPLNHPQRRVGALATLVGQWDEVSTWWEQLVNNLEKTVSNSLSQLRHPFWEMNYTLQASPATSRLRLLGKDRTRDLLGNVIFPGAIGFAGLEGLSSSEEQLLNEFFALGKVDTNQHLRRAALRLFGPDGERQKLFTGYYHQQQGLLQVYRDFCLKDFSECKGCPFPEQLIQWQRFAKGEDAPKPTSETALLQ